MSLPVSGLCSLMSDEEFLAAFENGSLPFEQWTHPAHVRVAYLYASAHPMPEAVARMRSGIQSYNRAHDRPESVTQGYHETITAAFMMLVCAAHCRTGPHGSADEFCRSHPELLDKSVLSAYFSSERLMTAEAKREFAEWPQSHQAVFP